MLSASLANPLLPQNQLYSLLSSANTALSRLHSIQWVHRDVKAENLVRTIVTRQEGPIVEMDEVALIDLGSSVKEGELWEKNGKMIL